MAIVLLGPISADQPATDNLLVNPSFTERGSLGRPLGWEVFVLPMDGATGRVDAPDGSDPAAMLYNPAPYAEDPANNWSQSVVGDFEGSEIVLRGRIKTEDATEAALWLQCWDDSPAQVIAGATSAQVQSMSGTRDWTLVDLRLVAPSGTDFVMVRCVLRGEGRAWFDDLTLTAGTDLDLAPIPAVEPDDEPPAELPDYATNAALREAVAELQSSNRDLIERLESLRAGAPDATAGMDAEAWRDVLEAVRETDRSLSGQIARLQEASPEYERLAQENTALRDALVAMEGANATLQEQLREVREAMAAGKVDQQREPDARDVARLPELERDAHPMQEPPSTADEQTGLREASSDDTPGPDVDVDTTADVDIGEGAEKGAVPAADDALEEEIKIAREAANQLQERLRGLREGDETRDESTPDRVAPDRQQVTTRVPGQRDIAAPREGDSEITRPERPALPEQPTRPVVEGRDMSAEPREGLPTVNIDITGGPELLAPEEQETPLPERIVPGEGTSVEAPGRETDADVRASLAELERMNARLLEQVTSLAARLDEPPRRAEQTAAGADAERAAGDAELAEARASLERAVSALQATNQRLEERLAELERAETEQPPTAPAAAERVAPERELIARLEETNTALDELLGAFRTTNERLTQEVERSPAAISEALADAERTTSTQRPEEGGEDAHEQQAAPRVSVADPTETDRQMLAQLRETNAALSELAGAFRATNENLVIQLERLQTETREAREAADKADEAGAEPAQPEMPPAEGAADAMRDRAQAQTGAPSEPRPVPPLMPRGPGAVAPADATALISAQIAAAEKTAALEQALGDLQQTNERMLERLYALAETSRTPAQPQAPGLPEELLTANTDLQRSIHELQSLNRGLLDGIAELQTELRSLREEVAALSPDDAGAIAPLPEVVPLERKHGHILVPHNPQRGNP